MQDLIILGENKVYIQSKGKDYKDTKDNFLLDYGKVIPQMSVAQIVQANEGNEVATELQDISSIDYSRDVKSCWLNGHAFQKYPNDVCEDILNSIDVLLANKEKREYVAPTLEQLKQDKINEFKSIRDTEEVKPIAYNGNLFDFDDKARERINAAIIALSLQGEDASIDWTTADNADVKVTANDLRMVIAAVAVRSNALHTAYRAAKEKVEEATTAADVEAVTF